VPGHVLTPTQPSRSILEECPQIPSAWNLGEELDLKSMFSLKNTEFYWFPLFYLFKMGGTR